MKFFEQHLTSAQSSEILRRVRKVMRAEQFISGPEVGEFERALTTHFGMPAITCNSGTDALLLGLKALGIGPGDEVITTAFTYFATIEAIAALGAKPILVDIDRATFNIDPAAIEARITKRTKAVLVVHLFGLACEMKPIAALCKKRKLFLVEDCAQSFGARSGGQLTGTFGDLGCFSFFPTKNLGGFGDGGAVTVKSPRVARQFRLLKNHGQPRKYTHDIIGYNSRLDTIQAAVLLAKMGWLKDDLAYRLRRAEGWLKALGRHKNVISLPTQKGHTYNVFSMLVRNRAAFIKELERLGVPSAIYYELPVYRQKAYAKLFGRHRKLPNTEYVAKRIISLPVH